MRKRNLLALLGAFAYLGWRAVKWRSRLDLRNKVALITGGSRGLGLALARELARRGALVAICARTSEDLVWAKQDLELRGARVVALPCDVGDPAQVARLVAEVRLKLGPIDVLVNNAGVIRVGPIDSMTREDFEQLLRINFWGAVNTTVALLESMRQRRSGQIVNITSIGAKVAVPHLLAYDCAKFALQGFSEGLRAEVAKDGVGVTTIVPGLMRTGSPLHATFKGDAAKEFVWFASGDATPLTSMSAARAARRIVKAIVRREGQVTLSWQAKLLRIAHAVAPTLTTDALALTNRFLPEAGDHGHADGVKGREVLNGHKLVRAALTRASAAYNQGSG